MAHRRREFGVVSSISLVMLLTMLVPRNVLATPKWHQPFPVSITRAIGFDVTLPLTAKWHRVSGHLQRDDDRSDLFRTAHIRHCHGDIWPGDDRGAGCDCRRFQSSSR